MAISRAGRLANAGDAHASASLGSQDEFRIRLLPFWLLSDGVIRRVSGRLSEEISTIERLDHRCYPSFSYPFSAKRNAASSSAQVAACATKLRVEARTSANANSVRCALGEAKYACTVLVDGDELFQDAGFEVCEADRAESVQVRSDMGREGWRC
jgi:hypothetical protein